MKLVETIITDTVVRIRLADDPDRLKAQSWVDGQLAKSSLKRLSGTPAQNFDALPLPIARQVILENLRAAIDAEIAHLKAP